MPSSSHSFQYCAQTLTCNDVMKICEDYGVHIIDHIESIIRPIDQCYDFTIPLHRIFTVSAAFPPMPLLK